MAKNTPSKKIESAAKKSKAVVSTPVRNTAIPRVSTAPARKTIEITSDMIAKRAYEIHAGGNGGSELDNWFAAESQLRTGI